MSDCCDPVPYRRFFNRKEAARNVKAYRQKGLDSMASSMVDFLKSRNLEGADLLEVGGGIGAIQIELLKAGLDKSVNVELSSGYDDAAHMLAEEEGVEERITRHTGDFVERQDQIESADVVVMNRVICCYPWMERMMGAAVGKANRYLALVFPREKWWVKFGRMIANASFALRKCEFRSFVHSPDAIESVATDAGFVVAYADNSLLWQALVLERAA